MAGARHTLVANKNDTVGSDGTSSVTAFLFREFRANVQGQYRVETLNGREYWVVPARLIVPGVLNGSKGPLYYPPDEVVKNYDDWNGMPLTWGHPVDSQGNNVSARSPKVLAEYGIGWVFHSNPTNTSSLDGEAWFDVENTLKHDKLVPAAQQVLPRLRAGKPIELSTGLFTQDFPAPKGATHNGVEYTHIARNYRPDHLAVLAVDRGACSLDDGCGINVNQDSDDAEKDKAAASWMMRAFRYLTGSVATSQATANSDSSVKGDDVNRTQLIQWLVTNCDCWKGKDKALNDKTTYTDEDLKKFKANAEAALTVNKVNEKAHKGLMCRRGQWVVRNSWVVNAKEEAAPAGIDIGALADFFEIATDPKREPLKFVKELRAKVEAVLKDLSDATEPEPPMEEPTTAMDCDPNTDPDCPMPAKTNKTNTNKAPTMDAKQIAEIVRKEVQSAVTAAVNNTMGSYIDREKEQYINAIVAGETDPAKRATKVTNLQKKTVNELKELASYLSVNVGPMAHLDPTGMPLFPGAAGATSPTGNNASLFGDDNDDDFVHPVINWQEEGKARRAQTQRAG